VINEPPTNKTKNWQVSCFTFAQWSGGHDMEDKEKWMVLCEQAANEQNPQKLQALILQICVLLEAKERGLKDENPSIPLLR